MTLTYPNARGAQGKFSSQMGQPCLEVVERNKPLLRVHILTDLT